MLLTDMVYFSTFIVIYEDSDLPEIEFFCPLLWKKQDIKITGDYYFTNAGSRWNMLELTKTNGIALESGFSLNIFRKESFIGKTIEVEALKEYIHQLEQKWFAHEKLQEIKIAAVAKLSFFSSSISEYEDFLDTTYRFLKHTEGCLVHVLDREYNAEEFYSCFIEK